MAFKAMKRFKERHQNFKIYEKGDLYTYENKNRVAFLVKEGYLQEVKDKASEVEIKHVGGGWYVLPNGEKVKGKEAAIKTAKEM